MMAGADPFRATIRRRTIRTEVVEALRAALITGDLVPGVVYSAPQLGEMLGVSATPVREAMLELVHGGMVEVLPNKGFRVVELTGDVLDHIAEMRLLLEVPVMAEIAERCEGSVAQVIADLAGIAQELEEAARSRDFVRFIALDTDFHTRFLAVHGNPLLVDLVRDLRSRSRLYGLEALADRDLLQPTAQEHAEMIRLALARDSRGMRRVVAAHIGHVRGVWAAQVADLAEAEASSGATSTD